MTEGVSRVPKVYETTLDRTGFALGLGALLGGLAVLALVVLGGARDPLPLTGWFLLGSAFSAIAITAVAGPLWLVMHVAGLRRARHAAMVGAGAALAILVGAQTWGFGLLEMPPMDNNTLLYRWISAVLTSAVVAVVAGLIGLAMWRVAYRRVQ
ncbi:hypothetical protein P1X14_15345 [Sphingomonas sp. AOB5]|uniref:hypothetical protein n=1 Tax=Sphingomonas sp. AOB5 TaxID=3034017 RepID=UPI0023F8DDA9|nr:hypothetical protein [Sphingomonas sp. AOB5]MDF7776631.1 hypothetical protein [Sphingomonas sp. AOB5]